MFLAEGFHTPNHGPPSKASLEVLDFVSFISCPAIYFAATIKSHRTIFTYLHYLTDPLLADLCPTGPLVPARYDNKQINRAISFSPEVI